MILALLATAATGLFGGAALYITLVEHPARMSCGGAVAVAEFRPSYRRAANMQASLAVLGAVLGIMHWMSGGGGAWLVAGLLLGAIVLLTLRVIAPTNARLLDESLDENSAEALALLERWGQLHGMRTAMSLLAFAIELVVLVG